MNYGTGNPLVAMLPRLSGKVPTSVHLQLSDTCNHACTHCYQVHGQRGEMSTVEVEAALDDMAAAGVLFLTITGGEVTLRKDFLEILEYARKRRFAVKVYTNAYTIDDEMARGMAEQAVLEVHVSVYSSDPDAHDSVTRVPGSHARTIEGIRALKSQGVKVVMKMPFMNVNSRSYSEFVALAQSLGCDFTIDPTVNVREDGASGPVWMRTSDEDLRRLAADPIMPRKAPVGAEPPAKPLTATPCGACDIGYVMPDGTIRPCMILPYSLGNVREQSLADAYGVSPAAGFVRDLTWQNLPACRVCDLRNWCSRCHANALLEDGDIFGPASASCRWARVRFHEHFGLPLDPEDPGVGPFEITPERRLARRAWERERREVPADVKMCVVRGRDSKGRAIVRLPVLNMASNQPHAAID